VKVRRQRIAVREAATIDLTAFLSLMVILVPFLLVTAVFTQTTILELQPQRGEGSQHSASDPLQLQVVLRQEAIEVNYLALARPIGIDRTADGEAVVALAALAADLKGRYPGSLEATLLVEPQISYDMVVQVLDALRTRLPGLEQGDGQELFPLIALGPAAPTEQTGQPGL